MRRFSLSVLVLLLCIAAAASAAEPTEYDDCDANFIAFIGSSAYQFSPAHVGELGAVRLFAILSYQRAAHAGRFGFAVWKLTIDRADDGLTVMTVDGRARIDREGATLAEFYWDGRDERGELVPAGRYRYTFAARYAPDARLRGVRAMAYDAIDAAPRDEALASTDEVIVNYDLAPPDAHYLRLTAMATSCQSQQNAPMEAGFAYNFYYGSTHAHSNWSDGGQPTTNCQSGNGYGSGSFAPPNVFAFARDTALLDYWLVNEHNHLIQDAIATNNPPVTEAKVKQRYADGIAAASSASTASFVGLYGMEWGVTTNTDQGHVTLIETPKLFGWETCTTCNGPSAECTPGTNCYFDVFTPKRFGYLALYAASVANPSAAGALGVFNHPGSGEFDNFAFNANADDAMQGIAVRSGLAFATQTDCGTGNIGSTDYSGRWREALNKGFHLAPTADHDSHCNNYGTALPMRTVYLAPSLSKANLLAAHKARHFYATEDPNAQLVFRTAAGGGRIMGDIFTAAGGATLVANLYDPDAESTTTLELWRGQIGAGAPAAPYQTWSGTSSMSFTESLTTGSYWYYVHAVQADGHDVWSAPMWITYQAGGGDTTAPATSITAPANGATVSGSATNVTAAASDNVGVTQVEFWLDGALKSTDTSSPYAWTWDTTASSNGAHALVSKAYDAAANVGTSATVNVTVSNTVSGVNIGGWIVTQANATLNYTIPAGTVIPSEGYVVIGRNATKAQFETFWARTLGANVVYLNSADTMPQINGDENFTLKNASSVVVDGPSINMPVSAARSIQRNDPCTPAWSTVLESAANPGSGAAAGCAGGVKINEFSDASGTGNFIYEFIELHNDSAAAGDTTAPTTSITAPANGASVSGTVNVTASASDNVGVTKVEFWLDGALQSTDTSSPYAWSWNSSTASNGAHALTSKAYDAATNVGTSPAVTVTVNNGITLTGYSILQANASLTYTLPAGTFIPSNGYVIVGRNATKAQFETFWGVTLAANVVYLNAADTMPQINGSETYTLRNASATVIDGATVAMAAAGGESLRRTNACAAANLATSWTRAASSTGNPGTGAPAACGKGVYLSEFSDALGTGNFIYEFVELFNDN